MKTDKESGSAGSFERTETTDQIETIELIGEEPFLIRVDDKPYSVVMRTPGDELAHAAGLCLGEGILDSPDDFKTLGYDENLDPNVVDVWLTPERQKKIPDILKRKTYISQTSCGICGKQMIRDLDQVLRPAQDGFTIRTDQIFECVNRLFQNQSIYPRTRGSHASILFDNDLKVLAFAEDVGRHNALDKVLGKAFLDRTLDRAGLVVMSSRISYELVQKAARAGLPMMVSKSRPTALAAKMGRNLNMTLACAFEKTKLIILCGEQRISRI
ncbi:formate dehydrogenase accessory sulfurtransferase FdhD [Desulfospira joergensenii]|uniref:formate dehydrogenase accessory sulfurtransferase FdhD n=1 Tax=Desulfospira joergensenii TaxID=53329 RepID=UPI0003B67D84|nr:formate dehydrogenase accessory sulfurtransferase FdhD [Desulfospira joergensenii]